MLDKKALGPKAFDIASDIMFVDPDLAIRIVEETTATGSGSNDLDWAFGLLSIAALNSRDKESRVGAAEKTRARIKDPKAKAFFDTASMLLGDSSAANVIARIEKLELKNRLFFLRQWSAVNSERSDAADVIDYSLDLLVKDTLYTPKTRDLREIATPLPAINDLSRARHLVGRFDSQKGAIETLGTSQDYVRLQLLLAATELKYDGSASRNRVIEIYWYINNLEDLAVKTECIGWLLASFRSIDPDSALESTEGLHSLARDEMRTAVDELLLSTADQYEATKGLIRALAKGDLLVAFEIAVSLNAPDRRDSAILDLIEGNLQLSDSALNYSKLEEASSHIVDPEIKARAYQQMVSRLARFAEPLGVEVVLPVLGLIPNIEDAEQRCIALCLAYVVLDKQHVPEEHYSRSQLLHSLRESWQSIDKGWDRVDVGFKIAKVLAPISVDVAKEYIQAVDDARDEVSIDANTPAVAFLACLDLTARAFTALLLSDLKTQDDLSRVGSLIDRIPSNGERAMVWGEIAIRAFLNGKPDICRFIATEHVRPLLQAMSDLDARFKRTVLIEVLPALYCAHRGTALELMASLPQPYRDEAYRDIGYLILQKRPPSDPYDDWSNEGFKVAYEDCVDVCGLLEHIEDDGTIYFGVRCISESLASRKNKNHFTTQQKLDIGNRLRKLIEAKLPNLSNVKHDGYKIAALTQVARIEQSPVRNGYG